MALTVATSFSLYHHIDRASVRNIFTENPKILASWCKMMEKAVIDFRLDAEVYAGFQKLRRLSPIFPRYQKMAATARGIWVFGENDMSFPPIDHLNYVALEPDDELTREWFLVVEHRNYARALVAREVTPASIPLTERVFEGVLVNDWDGVRGLKRHLQEAITR